jgi:hypothetical protein
MSRAGFLNSYNVNAGDSTGSWASGFTPRNPEWADMFVVLDWKNGTSMPSSAYYLTDASKVKNDSALLYQDLTSGNVYMFADAGALSGMDNPKLYAPSTWQNGSSVTHLDPATYPPGDVNSLMTPSLGSAQSIHNPGPVALDLLGTVGWYHKNAADFRLPAHARREKSDY